MFSLSLIFFDELVLAVLASCYFVVSLVASDDKWVGLVNLLARCMVKSLVNKIILKIPVVSLAECDV